MTTSESNAFEGFMNQVDRILARELGMESSDLPDFLYRDAYEEGQSAHEVAADVISLNMENAE